MADQFRTAPAIRQVKERPGLLLDEERGTYYKLVDTLAHAQYDSVIVQNDAVTSTIPFGTEYEYCRDIANKQRIDCNFRTPRKLTAGQVMWASRVGVFFPYYIGSRFVDGRDIMTVVDNSYVNFTLNGRTKLEGFTAMFPPGFGYYGSTSKNNDSIISLGIPSLGGVLPLAKKLYINSDHEMGGILEFQRRTWIAGIAAPFLAGGSVPAAANNASQVLARLMLHGRLYQPSTT